MTKSKEPLTRTCEACRRVRAIRDLEVIQAGIGNYVVICIFPGPCISAARTAGIWKSDVS